MEHSVSNSSFAQLDSIFETHRSNEAIATLEQRVINHEKAVQRQAELAIQQQRLSQAHLLQRRPLRMGGETNMRSTSYIERCAYPQRSRKLFGLLCD